MRKPFLYIFSFCLLTIWSCDDGDILDFEFEFDEEFEYCEGVSDLVLYKTKTDPSESMSLLISNYELADLLEVGDDNSLSLEDVDASFTYRSYYDTSIDDIFCNEIPTNLNINIDETDDVLLDIVTILTSYDDDDVDTEDEYDTNNVNGYSPLGDEDGDGVYNYLDDDSTDDTIGDEDGEIEAGFDTDGDGIPNFIDADDDGDNVLTTDENPDPDGNGDYSDAQDTDEDGIPDYLDNDDDEDGVLTRDEENDSADQNPTNDISDGVTPDYLNDLIKITVPATAYRSNTYYTSYYITLDIKEIGLSIISQDTLDFGYMIDGPDTVTTTPDFN
ncbi:hypothetical protein [Neotamlana laminarinivorans]|uniref:Uncharacterized protein n=1 Tax=Neotamlana laminarinivorans TaxID=2883124 RepID=A0A9X1L024_9FLAO|nr:hypothetical protein [Tamlana laminarinivorans]MCB4797383.1 hypothetical protein [Tamlana laminarinivorans]